MTDSHLSWQAKLYKTTKCAKDFTRDFRRVAKCVKNTVGGYYRPDLSKAALARWTKFHRSLKVAAAKKVQPAAVYSPASFRTHLLGPESVALKFS